MSDKYPNNHSKKSKCEDIAEIFTCNINSSISLSFSRAFDLILEIKTYLQKYSSAKKVSNWIQVFAFSKPHYLASLTSLLTLSNSQYLDSIFLGSSQAWVSYPNCFIGPNLIAINFGQKLGNIFRYSRPCCRLDMDYFFALKYITSYVKEEIPKNMPAFCYNRVVWLFLANCAKENLWLLSHNLAII